MSKEDIIEGLKMAMARGATLQTAMMSFYNSGYAKEDIEAAARSIGAPVLSQPVSQSQSMPAQVQVKVPSVKPTVVEHEVEEKELKASDSDFEQAPEPTYSQYSHAETGSQTSEQQYPSLQPQQTIQRVSNYEDKPSKMGTVVIFVLVFVLLALIGILVSVFLFRQELATFFNSFIG